MADPPPARATAARATIIRFQFSRISNPPFGFLGSGLVPLIPVLPTSPMFFFLSTVSIKGQQTVRYPDGEVFSSSDLAIAGRKHPEDMNLGTEDKQRPARQHQGGPFRRSQPLISFRAALNPNDIATVTAPSSPTKGRYVPVFGKVDAICSSRGGAGWSA